MSLIDEKRLALMLLLAAKGSTGRPNEPVDGITRLQKLMFILVQEHKVTKRLKKIDFSAYAFGPFAPELYDEIGFLRNLGYLADGTKLDVGNLSGNSAPARDTDELDDAGVSFDFLMGDIAQDVPDRYQTERFSLSEKGLDEVKRRLKIVESEPELKDVVTGIEEVKSRFNMVPLRDLIRYVYDKYPEYAVKSVIAKAI